uniref:Uncharacterized protein n=1 Tax=Rhizophora mucronata TaxID=61149 RepID=A0A2P2P443_RHIMU
MFRNIWQKYRRPQKLSSPLRKIKTCLRNRRPVVKIETNKN